MNIFSEIYGTYFRIAAKLLEKEITDDKTVNETVQREGFRDSVLFLPQKLIPNGEDWGLFRRTADGKLKRITNNPPVRVLTALQKSWLKAKLTDKRIRLFMDDDTLKQLDEKLADVRPFYLKEQFRLIDRSADRDNFGSDEYIANFRSILDAVKHRRICTSSLFRGTENERAASLLSSKWSIRLKTENSVHIHICSEMTGSDAAVS